MNKTDNFYFGNRDGSAKETAQLRSNVIKLTHRFFSDRGFTYVDPPILHERIPRKKHEIYLPLYEGRYSLNSSCALYMGAYASMLGNVYSISPTFRDEQNSINHLVEFRMLEVEVVDMTYRELPDFVESYIGFILNGLAKMNVAGADAGCPYAGRAGRLQASLPFQRVTYESFINGITLPESENITPREDPSSIDHIISRYIGEPTFITDYPRRFATWTAKPKNSVESCAINLMLPETFGELCEGCERTNDVELLRYKMNCAGIDNLHWYLDAVSQITQPRCGFGIGIDRLVRWIAGLPNISDTVLFPRMKEDSICQSM